MADISIQDLMAAGTHFGHQSKRWDPRMKKYIFGTKNGINIIDLNQTVKLFKTALGFVRELGEKGGTLLFVGTKNQAKNIIAEEAKRCGMPYMTERWLGGTLTNFDTVKKSVARLAELDTMAEDGTFEVLFKKEVVKLEKERTKLERNLGGIKNMGSLPSVIFFVDTIKEKIGLLEAIKLNIPVIAIVDTNCNPEGIDYVIPGNDDALKSIKLITGAIVDELLAGKEEFKLKQQAMAEEAARAQEAEKAEKKEKKDAAGAAAPKVVAGKTEDIKKN